MAAAAAAAPAAAPAAAAARSGAPPAAAARLRAFLQQHYLPISLSLATLFGFLVPAPGIAASRTPVNTISIVGIFFISGLQLQPAEMRQALKAYPAYLFGLLSILLLSPLASLAIARLPTAPRELALGQALFMAMPTTVSSGAVLTGEAKGNVALAILLSVVSNVIGVFTVPFFIAAFLNSPGAAAFNPAELLWKLTASILLPLGVGQALKALSPAVAGWVRTHKAGLKYASSALLVLLPWVIVSASAERLATIPGASFALLVLMAVGFHGVLLAANYAAARTLPIGLSERKALVINAAQKTVNTALSVVQFLPDSGVLGVDKGLLLIPCLISHFTQIIMDSFVASRWKRVLEEPPREAAPAGGPAAAAVATAAAGGGAPPAPADDAPAAAAQPGESLGGVHVDAATVQWHHGGGAAAPHDAGALLSAQERPR